jgi:uncharacterized protein (TIGR02145 family)
MKKIFLLIVLTSSLVACNKETTTPTTNGIGNTTTTDTTKTNNQITGVYGSNIIDKDGNTYQTVYIGKQHWMAENLKTTKYNDGTDIPHVTDKAQWLDLSTGAWVYYNNDASNNSSYGKLYNWYTISPNTNGNKNVCPLGWHVPSDSEWDILIDNLGGESVAGGKMKQIGNSSWDSPNTYATNSSLFTGLAGGERLSGEYLNSSLVGSWWSSTEKSISEVWNYKLYYDSGYSFRDEDFKSEGLSIRCIKD